MPTVEFVYEKTCPFVRDTRRRLIEAFQAAGLPPRWTEWEVSDPHVPERVRSFGSPTVLVNGRDIAGAPQDTAEHCCRIYTHADGPRGVPPLQMISAELMAARDIATDKRAGYPGDVRSFATLLPAVGLAALPKLTCPVCWPAYAGLLSSFGIGFVNYTPYLMPLTAMFLLISVLALGYRAEQRRGYGPFILGVLSALAVLVGKFGYDNDPSMWVGLGTLVLASVWNSWPSRVAGNHNLETECPACAD